MAVRSIHPLFKYWYRSSCGRMVAEKSFGSNPEMNVWLVIRESLSSDVVNFVVTDADQREPVGRRRRGQMIATEAFKTLRNRRFGPLALADRDEHRGETSHHVVTEGFGANGEFDCWRAVRRKSPVVSQAFPSRVNDPAKQWFVRLGVRGSTTERSKIVQAENFVARAVHRVEVQRTLHRPGPRVGQIQCRRRRLEYEVAILTPRR